MDILLREGLFGRTLNHLSNNRIFPHWDASTSAEDTMPQNWPTLTKAFVMADVMLLNFSFYAASAIFTPSIPLMEREFGATASQGTLGLSLFVIAYGIGPLIVSHLLSRGT
jgi:DHA1 family multidrug resistance protein-like MFS transporter